jgi:hypothetical protein
MSASIPTPKALAARPRQPLTARPATAVTQAPAPMSLPESAPFRMRYELGIRHSNLPKNARLLALVLATWADWETGHIPEGRQPGIPLMARATGLVEGSVREALYALKDRGWVRRTSNPAGGHRPSEITLTIPLTR